MRPAPPAAVLLVALALAGGARAGAESPGGGAIATAPQGPGAPADERALAAAARAPDAPARRPARPADAPVVLSVASAPAAVFQDDETGRQIEAFVNGPGARAPGDGLAEQALAEPPRCDETPHGEVGAEYGIGGHHSQGGGGYGTVALPVAHCHGLVVLSVSGDRFGRR